MASKIAAKSGLLGTVITPPFERSIIYDSIIQMLELANRLNCALDIHIDESQEYPAAGIKQLIRALDDFKCHVPITCSHASSMSLLHSRELTVISEQLAKHEVQVVALPLTNAWLLGRHPSKTPFERPLAPIYQLQKAGVDVSVGGDNVQDPWLPIGNFDPISLMSFSVPIAHLTPWTRLGLAPFTTAPARLMSLNWDGIIDVGGPADLMLLEASSWAEALSSPPSREIFIKGELLN